MAILKKILKWAGIIVGGLFILFVLLFFIRLPHIANKQKTDEVVAKIHGTKLTIDDVMGKNLPPAPGPDADKTIAGIDANKNGIRDDVELAIFKEYPNSARTRAVLLQYALTLQMEVMQSVVNEGVVGEVANKQDRAIFCVAKIIPGGGEGSVFSAVQKFGESVFAKQFNTTERRVAHKDFYAYLKSGRIDDSIPCDVELGALLN